MLGDFLEPSMDLLKFYRSKISGFEAERAEFLARLADVEVRHAPIQQLVLLRLAHMLSCISYFISAHSHTCSLQAQNAEMHRLRWELRAREDEVGQDNHESTSPHTSPCL